MKYLISICVFILALLTSINLQAQKQMQIETVSRTMDYTENDKACVDIMSADGDLRIRSIMEEFQKTKLEDGTYVYKAILDLESGKKRKFYISAPLVMEEEYSLTSLQSNEYIKIAINIPKSEMSVTEMTNLVPSKSSNAVYQFFANISDMQITTNTGLEFICKGKNDASFYVYELSVPVAGTSGLSVQIKAAGYNDLTYEITDVSQRVYGFFLFPKEECFAKNFELGNEYFKDGSYSDALRYYNEAVECKDISDQNALNQKLEAAQKYAKIKDKIYEYDNNAMRLGESFDSNIESDLDSTYWYRNMSIGLMRHLLKLNPSDKFCSQSEIDNRSEDLLNSSRVIAGIVTDIEYQNQYLTNVVIYGSENPKADKNKMVRIGQTDARGIFKIKVPNRYKILYFEHTDKNYNKPLRIDITDGKRYKYHVKLQRKVF